MYLCRADQKIDAELGSNRRLTKSALYLAFEFDDVGMH